MTTTMEQVVTRLRQEVFTFKAQVADQSGLQEAVRTTTISRQEEDSQQWSKKTEAFFACMIKESEMMLEWSAEQALEITTTTAIDLEFLPTVTNVERGVRNLEFVLQQMHTALMAPTSCEANEIVANSQKNPLEAWRRLQKPYDPTTGGRKRNLLRTIISLGRSSLLELQARIEQCDSTCRAVSKSGRTSWTTASS